MAATAKNAKPIYGRSGGPETKARRCSAAALAAACLGALALFCVSDRDPQAGRDKVAIAVTISGGGEVTQTPDDSLVAVGTVVTFRALPGAGQTFVAWRGDTQATANPLVVKITAPLQIEAVFAPRPRGLALILARDSSFFMGSATGDLTERPAHRVRFTHDFYIDVCEITQADFQAHMGYNPAAGKGYADAGDSFPVYEVSWYEAALFCNARSKAQGYDTVYTYTARCNGGQTCPYVLENLQIHYERFGYRLPTEAEWEYACRSGSAADYYWGGDQARAQANAWYFDNAGDRSHTVGGKAPNGFGLFDMAGNVAEFVNDWLGGYGDSAVTAPVGPTHLTQEEFERSWQRPVRGGCYALAAHNLRCAARTLGPYETAASARMKFIGFRTVMGVFIPAVGRLVDSVDPGFFSVRRDCEKSDLIAFLGTSAVKLAYVQGASGITRLYSLDFTRSRLQPSWLPDTAPVACLAISPNGDRVAYSSHGEGYSGASAITVRYLDPALGGVLRSPPGRSAFIPRWWIDTAGRDTSLIYTDGASINSSPRWKNEKTYRRRITGLSFAGPEEVVWASGSFHGGLSRDGRFLGTAFSTARLIDLQINDTALFYFQSPYNGRDDNPQVCNLSLCPSSVRTDEALLLDFGYSKVSALVGRAYGVHEYLFRCNSRFFTWEHVNGWWEKPAGFQSWNFPEYTNHPDFAVAVAQAAYADSNDAIFLINLADSSYLRILSGKGLRHPALWIDPAEKPEAPDPYYYFARYDLPVQWTSQVIMTKKLKLLWRRRSEIEMAFFGSSPVTFGFDPSQVRSLTTGNFGAIASNLVTSMTLAQNYALPHLSRLRIIALALDPGTIDEEYTQRPMPLTGLLDSKGFELDSANGFWRAGLPAAVAAKAGAFDSLSWAGYTWFGALAHPVPSQGWGPIIIEGTDYSFTHAAVQENLSRLQTLVDSAAAHGVAVLVVNFPEAPGFKDTTMAGRFGPSHATFAQIEAWLRSLELRRPNFHYYDANLHGSHDYADADAYDCNHLSSVGALKLSARIDSVAQTILQRLTKKR